MADNEIRLNVTAVESEPLNVCVTQVPMNPVNVENTYKGIDYNLLKNKPSIDGVTLEGDKTTAEVIGFDKEYVDEAILTTNAKIDEISAREGYSKEEIDNKVIVIEADIDANADAIQKTRSDFMESDSELQQQINAHAEELTTQKNDIDELGDQVAGIESKIPESTSDTNPLINKQQLLDEEMDIRSDFNESVSELQTQITAQASAIANKVDVTGDTMTGALNLPELNVANSEGTLNLSITAGVATIATNNGLDIVSQTKFDTAPTTDDNTTWADALDTSLVRKAQVATAIAEAGGGGSVPDNVYTQDNLIAGKNVTFTEVPPEGGIDEHTIDVFHFEEDSFAEDTFGELGNVKLGFSSGSYSSLTNGKFGKGLTGSSGNNWGFGFVFVNRDLNLSTPYTLDFWIKPNYSRDYVKLASNLYNWELLLPNNKLVLNFGSSGLPEKTSEETLENNVWSHIALTTDGTTFITVYLNGKPCIHQEGGLNVYDGSASGVISANAYGVVDWDEIRISDNIRYTEEFTPPTKAYTVATGPSKTAVNAVIPEVDIPEGIYTQSNLLGGKDIEIVPEPVEGGIDEHTIAVWHFDGNTNWVDDRGVEYPSDFTYQDVNLNSTYSKFGNGSVSGPNYYGAQIDPATLQANYGMKRANRNESFTIDWWSLWVSASSGTWFSSKMGFVGSNYGFEIKEDIRYIANVENTINIRTAGVEHSAKFDATAFGAEYGKWVHKALEYDCSGDTAVARLYINGHIAATIEGIEKSATEMGTFQFGYGANEYFDEVRISKTARYKGVDFSDSLPTKAYSVAEPTGNMVVNFTGKAGGNGKNIGEVYYSQSSLATDNSGALPLWTGESVATAMYPSLTEWVTKHTELQCTAEEYESALSTYGECPKYVLSTDSLRLPKLANYIKMANGIEGITQKEAGLPNLIGTIKGIAHGEGSHSNASGVFKIVETHSESRNGIYSSGTGPAATAELNASEYNNTYGKSGTVTPAHTTLFPWVVAYTASIEASVAQAAEFQQGLSGKVDLPAGVTNDNVDYVVESYNDGTNWYRVYKSGWLEQGGRGTITSGAGFEIITLLKPMLDANYTLLNCNNATGSRGDQRDAYIISETQIGVGYDGSQTGGAIWYVCGKGAQL